MLFIKNVETSSDINGGGVNRPDNTLQGWHPNEKKIVGEFTKTSEQTRSDRWKGAWWHSPVGKMNKWHWIAKKGRRLLKRKQNRGYTAEMTDRQTVMTKKGRQFFSPEKIGVTPSVNNNGLFDLAATAGLDAQSTYIPVSYTHLTLPTIYSV